MSIPLAQAITLSTTMMLLLVAVGGVILAALAELLPRLLARRAATPLGIDLGSRLTLRSARRVDAVLLDAWGTITDGELEVIAVDPVEPDHERNLRWFAGALGHAYQDPVGRAVSKLAGRGYLSNIETRDGLGISGSVDRHPVRVGRTDWIGIEDTPGVGTRVGVEVDQRPLGRITVAPVVRPHATDAVRRLTDLGVEPLLVTDLPSQDTDRLADAAGITQRWAETAPAKRGRLVCELQERGQVVAMVGPGDSQPDAHAEACLSVGDRSGDGITLRDFDVSGVVDALTLARRIPRVQVVNRIIVLVAVLLALPLAALTTLSWTVSVAILLIGLVAVVLQSLGVSEGIPAHDPRSQVPDRRGSPGQSAPR